MVSSICWRLFDLPFSENSLHGGWAKYLRLSCGREKRSVLSRVYWVKAKLQSRDVNSDWGVFRYNNTTEGDLNLWADRSVRLLSSTVKNLSGTTETQLWHAWNASILWFYEDNELSRNLSAFVIVQQELCESRGGRPGLSVLTSLLVSADAKNYWTVLRHWSQLVPNMSADIWGH